MAKKTYQGEINDKERSKKKLLDAVGEVIKTKGYTGLNATNIATSANLDRKLIKVYFENVDNLIETYVKTKDYWIASAGSALSLFNEATFAKSQEIMESLLHNQFDYFLDQNEMQKIILWQLSQPSKIMFEIAEEREKLGDIFFELADPAFENTEVDIRAVGALLVAGIYYLILHAKSNNSLFCQIDVDTEKGAERIKKAISFIINKTYEKANN